MMVQETTQLQQIIFPSNILDNFFKRRSISLLPNPRMGTPCHLWNACINKSGYGLFTVWNSDDKKSTHWKAHRFAYTFFKGHIPNGLQIDHLCENKLCINPEHLEAKTPQANSQTYHDNRQAEKTMCKKGLHKWVKENIYVFAHKDRRCRECRKLNSKKWRDIKKRKQS